MSSGPVHVRDAVRRSRRVSRRSRGAPNRARAQGVRRPRSAHPIAPGRCAPSSRSSTVSGRTRRSRTTPSRALSRSCARRSATMPGARSSSRPCPTRGYRWLPEPDPVPLVDSPREADRFRVRSARTLGFAGAAIALVAAVAVFAVSHHAAADRSALDAPIPMPAQQLTVSPGLDAFPTLSPDGRLVAYASNESGAFEIHVRAMSGGAAERPVTADRQQNVEPAWSPDGELIAYHSRRLRRHLGRSGAGRRAAEDQRVRVAPCVVARRPASGVPVRSLHRRLAVRVQREHPVRNLGHAIAMAVTRAR